MAIRTFPTGSDHRPRSTVPSSRLADSTTDDGTQKDADFRLGGDTGGWQGQAPSDIEGATNPTLTLQAGTEYTLVWENIDGIQHNFAIEVFLIKETVQLAQLEADDDHHDANLPFNEVLKRATYGDRTLFAAAQAGHIENFVDTLFWIAVPLYLTSQGLAIEAVGVVVGVHSAMYFLQIGTGGLADRIGRRPPVVGGMFLAGAGVLGMIFVDSYLSWTALAGISGLGMALLYPNLMTVPSDAAHPTWRSAGMGVYRMWRDAGYGVGAILIGLSMEFVNAEAAFYMTAILMFLSGAVVYLWMEETHPDFGTHEPPAPAPEASGQVTPDD